MHYCMLPEVLEREEQMYERLVELLLYLEQFEFVRFLGSTGVSGAIFAGIFFPLQWWTCVHYRKSLYIAFIPSLIAGFVMHKYWTFGNVSSELVSVQMTLYALKRLVFVRINDHLLHRLVERHRFSPSWGQALIAGCGVLVNYVISKLIFSL